MDLLGYRELTLKSDTAPAIIAFSNRVAEMCKAEFTKENVVKGDKESNGLIENAVILVRGIIRTNVGSSTQEPVGDESLLWWSMQDASCPDVKRVETGRRHFERLHSKKPIQEHVPFGEKVLDGSAKSSS